MTQQDFYQLAKVQKDDGDQSFRALQYDKAIQSYSTAIKILLEAIADGNTLSEDSTSLLYITYSNRCASYLHVNNNIEALLDAQECVKLQSTWYKGYLRLGQCYQRLQRKHEAIAAYEQVLVLDGENVEARQALAKLKTSSSSSTGAGTGAGTGAAGRSSSTAGTSSFSSSSSSGTSSSTAYNRTSSSSSSTGNRANTSSTNFGTNHSNNTNTPPSMFSNLTNINWQQIWTKIQQQSILTYYKAQNYWQTLPEETRKYVVLAMGILVAYYFFFYRSASSYSYSGSSRYRHYDDYEDYGRYGSSYYGSGGGMSWFTWAAIMYAAYSIPPMFPDQLGQYARPFFGMSWTTFMWLISFITNNNRRGGGMYYGGRPGFGFGGRRYY